MKKDMKQLLAQFSTPRVLHKGDLVVTAEIHRVIKKFGPGRYEVATIWPECGCCRKKECIHPRVMHVGPGQHGVMKLKRSH